MDPRCHSVGRWTAAGVVVLAVACRVYGVPQYPAAAIFAGTAVGATAVNRSMTGGCWAVCSHGWHCDQDSGLCVENAKESDRSTWSFDAGPVDAKAEGIAGSPSDVDAESQRAAAHAGGPSVQLEGAAGAAAFESRGAAGPDAAVQ